MGPNVKLGLNKLRKSDRSSTLVAHGLIAIPARATARRVHRYQCSWQQGSSKPRHVGLGPDLDADKKPSAPKRFSVDVSLLLREEEIFDCVQKASMILGKRVGAMFTGDGDGVVCKARGSHLASDARCIPSPSKTALIVCLDWVKVHFLEE
jgi:hypothetical protein